MSNRRPLARFEALAQRFFEGSLDRVLDTELTPGMIAALLLQEMEDSEAVGAVADNYDVYLNPADRNALLAGRPDLADELAAVVEKAGNQMRPEERPTVRLLPDDELATRQIRVVAGYGEENSTGGTTSIRPADERMVANLLATLDAFVIVDGQRHVPLDRPFMTIGRHIDNDIVLDHSSVSRHHAQLRLRNGHFVLYDAGSRGGITVNSQPAQEWVLRQGDLIYLSRRVPLIYGEGLDSREQLPSSPGEEGQETAVIPTQEG